MHLCYDHSSTPSMYTHTQQFTSHRSTSIFTFIIRSFLHQTSNPDCYHSLVLTSGKQPLKNHYPTFPYFCNWMIHLILKMCRKSEIDDILFVVLVLHRNHVETCCTCMSLPDVGIWTKTHRNLVFLLQIGVMVISGFGTFSHWEPQ